MHKNIIRNKKMFAAVITILAIGAIAWFAYSEKLKNPAPAVSNISTYVNNKGEKWTIQKGEYSFTVSSATEFPRITSGKIDPLDVKLGDTQKMKLVIKDIAPLKSVIAEIETDRNTATVQLQLTTSTKDLYTYEGEWKVVDTHAKTYHTTFIAEGANNKKDKITLAWSDPVCSWNSTGSLLGSCSSGSSAEGMDGTNMSLNGYTVTLSVGETYLCGAGLYCSSAWGVLNVSPGYSLTIGTGSVVIGTGGGPAISNKFSLCMVDADGDGYPKDGGLVQCTAGIAGNPLERNIAFANRTITDCNDAAYSTTNTCAPVCTATPSYYYPSAPSGCSLSGAKGWANYGSAYVTSVIDPYLKVNTFVNITDHLRYCSPTSKTSVSVGASACGTIDYAFTDVDGFLCNPNQQVYCQYTSQACTAVAGTYYPSAPLGCSTRGVSGWATPGSASVTSVVDPFVAQRVAFSKIDFTSTCGSSISYTASSYACGYALSALTDDGGNVCRSASQVYCQYSQ